MPRRAIARILLAAIVSVAAAACSDREDAVSPDDSAQLDNCERFPNLCELSDEDLRIRVGGALETAGSYRVTVRQENLVLPRWGGSDGGTVAVDVKSGAAVADLRRTGDGQYAVVLRGGETYFKRETCPTWARIQDGTDVLAPFVITPEEVGRSRVLQTISRASDSTTLLVDLAGLGEVTLEIDNGTGRPLRLWSGTLTNNGKRLDWTFDRWAERVRIPDVSADRLSGPGGNPC